MRIINCEQGSDEWVRWRARPTASNFSRVVTPARGDYSKTSTDYACEIVAKRLGVFTEPPPSFWMQWGTEHELNAVHAYERLMDTKTTKVGFCLPDHTDGFGCSPDRLVGDDGLLECKCPKPETLIRLHADGIVPDQYRPQLQGQLLVTGRAWVDFFAWHPELNPFCLRVEPDIDYQAKIADGLVKLLDEIQRIETKVRRQTHEIVCVPMVKSEPYWGEYE